MARNIRGTVRHILSTVRCTLPLQVVRHPFDIAHCNLKTSDPGSDLHGLVVRVKIDRPGRRKNPVEPSLQQTDRLDTLQMG